MNTSMTFDDPLTEFAAAHGGNGIRAGRHTYFSTGARLRHIRDGIDGEAAVIPPPAEPGWCVSLRLQYFDEWGLRLLDDARAVVGTLSAPVPLPGQLNRPRFRWRACYGPEPLDARGRPDLRGRLERLQELVAQRRRELDLLAADGETQMIPSALWRCQEAARRLASVDATLAEGMSILNGDGQEP